MHSNKKHSIYLDFVVTLIIITYKSNAQLFVSRMVNLPRLWFLILEVFKLTHVNWGYFHHCKQIYQNKMIWPCLIMLRTSFLLLQKLLQKNLPQYVSLITDVKVGLIDRNWCYYHIHVNQKCLVDAKRKPIIMLLHYWTKAKKFLMDSLIIYLSIPIANTTADHSNRITWVFNCRSVISIWYVSLLICKQKSKKIISIFTNNLFQG